MNEKLSSTEYHLRPVTKEAPTGVKVLKKVFEDSAVLEEILKAAGLEELG